MAAPATPEEALQEFVAMPLPRLRAWLGEWGPAAADGARRALGLLRDGLAARLRAPGILDQAVERIRAEAPGPERRPALLTVLAACGYVRRLAPIPFRADAVAASLA